jgi:hypothetical protein
LAVCYAHLKKTPKAIKILLDAKGIFEKIYKDLRKENPFDHESMFIQAQIESYAIKYREAI